MSSYNNFYSNTDPDYMAMQANYLRMLANYYKTPIAQSYHSQESDPEENILERSLQAESVFLQNEPSELETLPIENPDKEYLNSTAHSKSPVFFNTEEDFNSYKSIKVENNTERLEEKKKWCQQFDMTDLNNDEVLPSHRKNSLNTDELPIKPAKVPFDQLLERELKKCGKGGNDGLPPRVKEKFHMKEPLDDMPFKKSEEKKIRKSVENPQKHEFLKRKNRGFQNDLSLSKKYSDISPERTPKTQTANYPVLKSNFLKRGEGKLCIKQQKPSKSCSSANTSKILYSEKSEVFNDLQFSDKEDIQTKSDYLQEKIEHYNNENKKLQRLIKEAEEKTKRLDIEKHEFLKEKEKHLAEFEKWKQEEMEKIKIEKLALEKTKRIKTKETEKISELKAKILDLETVIKEQEAHYQEVIEKLQDELHDSKSEKSLKNSNNASFEQDLQEENDELNESEEDQDQESHEKSKNSDCLEEYEEEDHEYRPKSGKKEVVLSNGIRKEIYPDGYSIVYFNNKDVKQCFPDGRIIYHFSESNTTQTTFPDGLQMFKFSNGQIEKHFPDGSKEISFQDGTVKCIYPDGQEESVFPDGTVQTVDTKGVKYIEFVNGQKDTIYPNGVKIRKFPDGRIRKIMPDGKVIEQ